jgi:replication factor C subunit 1
MKAIEEAADELSYGDIMTRKVYQTQNWGLIPHAISQPLCAVKKVSGKAPFQIFPQLLGKMSKQRKHARLMEDMARRMTGGRSASVMRMDYADPLRRVISNDFLQAKPSMEKIIQRMESLGMTRDDLFESLEETGCESITIPTKVKTAFTREWNKTHGGSDISRVRTKGARGKRAKEDEEKSDGVVNDDDKEEVEDDGDEVEEDEWEVEDAL